MSSIRRILASRANGALSRGPSTPQGKRLSSQNARTHGLLARDLLLDSESHHTFARLLRAHLDRFQPADQVEYGLIEEMVAAHWRMRRAWALETRMLQNQAAGLPVGPDSHPLDHIAEAFTALAATPSLALIHRYETRLHLVYQRALHNLLLLRIAAGPDGSGPGSAPLAPLPAPPSPGADPAVPNEPNPNF